MRKQTHLLVISVGCKPNFALIDESFVKVRLSVDFVVEQWDASAFSAAWHEAEAVQPAALHRPEAPRVGGAAAATWRAGEAVSLCGSSRAERFLAERSWQRRRGQLLPRVAVRFQKSYTCCGISLLASSPRAAAERSGRADYAQPADFFCIAVLFTRWPALGCSSSTRSA